MPHPSIGKAVMLHLIGALRELRERDPLTTEVPASYCPSGTLVSVDEGWVVVDQNLESYWEEPRFSDGSPDYASTGTFRWRPYGGTRRSFPLAMISSIEEIALDALDGAHINDTTHDQTRRYSPQEAKTMGVPEVVCERTEVVSR